MTTGSLEVCILAAGVGSRMKSDKPKALQTLAGRPLLAHLLESLEDLNPTRTHVVIGQGAEQVKSAFDDRTDVNWVLQSERRGTGHAMQQAAPSLGDDTRTVILLGDCPLIEPATIRALASQSADLCVLTVDMDDPFNYGRIIRDGDQLVAIVEEKDADNSQKKIPEINTGAMSVNSRLLKELLGQLNDNNVQKEYLLTDIVKLANTAGKRVSGFKTDDPLEVTGINTFTQLAALERKVQNKIAQDLMDNGVQVMDPARLDVRGNLVTGSNVFIDVNVVFEGHVELADNVKVGPNCVIKDCRIGAGTEIKANSVLDGAIMESDCSVGPFARLRPGTYLSEGVGIGNFVEVKKSKLGKGTRASHLAYLGDATLGEGVNIGAGTITCNYDGVNKWETHIGNDVFVGSNTSLVAPVRLADGVTTGAGSTISKNVDKAGLVIARAKQMLIEKWQRPVKADKKD